MSSRAEEVVVLHVVSNLTPGGAELMMKRLIARHLAGAGSGKYRDHVVSLREKASVGAQLEAMGIEVVPLGMTGPLSARKAVRSLAAIIERLKPDLVQTWLYHADLVGGIAARRAGAPPVIWNVRTTRIPPGRGTSAMTTLVRRACAFLSSRLPRRIVYVAESARRIHERLGYDASKSLVLPNGYDMPALPSPDARAAARARFDIPEAAVVIGSAGRYNALKDYPSFIAAAAALAARRPGLRFLLAGRELDRRNPELVAMVEASGFGERFHLAGEQQGLGDFLAATDIFCLHSIVEGFPNVVAEAMAMAVPCAVTDVGDAALIVGETGFVVPPERPELMAEALERLLAEPETERAERGRLARERIAANYSMEAIGARYDALYESVVAKVN
ncbi:MAG TPA: glycosyltransferase [Allosphingosinicella sp.]|jgi:glycosyltransferase involved in cell wall biosynthesis